MANQDIETKTDTTTHWQRFAVPFEFPVCFTENLFDLKNTTLVDVLSRLEPKKTHKALIFLDDGLSQAYPNLITDIATYVSHQLSLIHI